MSRSAGLVSKRVALLSVLGLLALLSEAGRIEAQTNLISFGDGWNYFIGTQEPSVPPTDWRTNAFDDSSWVQDAPTGIGYGTNAAKGIVTTLPSSDVGDGNYLTVYLRTTFTVADPSTIEALILDLDFDDGFVAFLNGTEVARFNTGAVGTELAFSDPATATHEFTDAPTTFDISASVGLLTMGADNLLAVELHNVNNTSSDILWNAQLTSFNDFTPFCPTNPLCVRRRDGVRVSWTNHPTFVFDSISVTRDGTPIAGSPFPGTTDTVFDAAGAAAPHTYAVVASSGAFTCAGISCSTGSDVTFVDVGEDWRFFRGRAEPSPGAGGAPTLGWTQLGFDDSAAAGWEQGPTGIGYADGDDATVLADMQNAYVSVYARKVFNLPSLAGIATLAVEIDYDDGVIAFLNGVEVARSANMGAAGALLAFDAVSTAGHESGTPELFAIGVANLRAGDNVLAIQCHNTAIDSSDLSLLPRLVSNLCVPVQGVTCVLDPMTGDVTVTWTASPHDSYVVTRNGTPIAGSPFAAGTTSVTDASPENLDNVYEVIGVLGGANCPGTLCTVLCQDVNPTALTCTLSLVDDGMGGRVTQAALAWSMTPGGTASIDIVREGALETTLGAGEVGYTDPNVESDEPEEDTDYTVTFRNAMGTALCTLTCGPLSLCPEMLTCEVVDAGGTPRVLLTWENVVKEWESYSILRDGALIEAGLAGDTTSYLDISVTVVQGLPIVYTLQPVAPAGEQVGCDRTCTALIPIPEDAKYVAPAGGWDYIIDFLAGEDQYNPVPLQPGNLDGSWVRAMEDSWDGSDPLVTGPAPDGDAPGGVAVEQVNDPSGCGDSNVLRVLDPGDPTSPAGTSLAMEFPNPYTEPNNRTIVLGRSTGVVNRNLLRDGVTIAMRWRLNPTPPAYLNAQPTGDGTPITNGLGQIGIYFQDDGSLGTAGASAGLSFVLNSGDLLQMSTQPVDGLGAVAATSFRSVWATVQDPEGDNTYNVTVYTNGQTDALAIFGTANDLTLQAGVANFGSPVGNFLAIAMADAGNDGDLQIDWVAYKEGIHTPANMACVPTTNNRPTARITVTPATTVTLAGGMAQVTLDSSTSDDGDGGTQGLTRSWSKVSGPAGDTIVSPTGVSTIVRFTIDGTYVYRLTVNDGQPANNTHSTTVTIIVNPATGGVVFRRGDADINGRLELTDAVRILNFLFLGTGIINCFDSADADDNARIELTDAVRVLNFLFLGTGVIPAPHPNCGTDPTADTLAEPCVYTASCI
jgi:hypothetical protein